jgi:hypothetical protein
MLSHLPSELWPEPIDSPDDGIPWRCGIWVEAILESNRIILTSRGCLSIVAFVIMQEEMGRVKVIAKQIHNYPTTIANKSVAKISTLVIEILT